MTHSLSATILQDRHIVALTGPDRIKFMQGLVTNDIRPISPERAFYTGILTGKGKLLFDCFIIDDGADRLLIDIADAHVEEFRKRVEAFKLRSKVDLVDPSPALAVAAVWGPGSAARLGLTAAEGAAGKSALSTAHYACVDPRLEALGVRVIFPADVALEADLETSGAVITSTGDYAAHRLGLGIADSLEIGGETLYPLEANFEILHGVDFKKGCYIGQEVTARMKLKGELRKRILPVVGSEALPPAGTGVTINGAEIGSLVAASGSQGLALLRLERLAGGHEEPIRAGDVVLTIRWPDWLPH